MRRPNEYFKFKQFTVWHDKCAMKVGTDGVLLGAWVNVDGARNILDVGTGTGLVALMMAQRCDAHITAVEIVPEAAEQARGNVVQSPWADRIEVVQTDFKEYQPEKKFDLIVSNPPYFVDSLLSPDKDRASARHTTDLNFYALIEKASKLLTPDGKLSMVIPTSVADTVEEIGFDCKLYPVLRVSVITRHGVESKRTLITLSPNYGNCVKDELRMEDESRQYTEEYRRIVSEYYLNI